MCGCSESSENLWSSRLRRAKFWGSSPARQLICSLCLTSWLRAPRDCVKQTTFQYFASMELSPSDGRDTGEFLSRSVCPPSVAAPLSAELCWIDKPSTSMTLRQKQKRNFRVARQGSK